MIPTGLSFLLLASPLAALPIPDPVQQDILRKAQVDIEHSRDGHPLYKQPNWAAERAKLAPWAAKGWFLGSREGLKQAVAGLFRVQGFGPGPADPKGGSVFSDVFCQYETFAKESGKPNSYLLYVLTADLQVRGAYVQVHWTLKPPQLPTWKMNPKFEFIPHPHPEYGNESPDIVIGTADECETKIQAGQFRYAYAQLQAGHLPMDSHPLSPALAQRLQDDWNYRLWNYIKTNPIGRPTGRPYGAAEPVFTRSGKGKIHMKGLPPPTGSTAGYIIYVSRTEGTGYVPYNDKAHLFKDVSNVWVLGLEPDKDYWWKVSAVSPAGIEVMGVQEIQMHSEK